MVIRVLSSKQKQNAEEVLRNYHHAFSCENCNEIYGTDKLDETKMCPKCFKLNKGGKKH